MDMLLNHKMIFDASPLMIWIIDEQGKVVNANRMACNDLHLPLSEIVGKSVFNLFPFDAHNFFSNYREIIESGKPVYESVEKCHKKDGTERWSLCTKIPYEENGKRGVCVFVMDITSQKRVEESLVASQSIMSKVNKILEVQAAISEKIMDDADEFDFDEILETTGSSLNLNSVFVYRCNGEAWLLNDWSLGKEFSLPSSIYLNGTANDVRSWIERGVPAWGSTKNLPSELKSSFQKAVEKGIGTIVFVPVNMSNEAWGIVGFGTKNGREWSQREIDALVGLGKLIAMLAKTVQDNREFRKHFSMRISEIESLVGRTVLVNGNA